MRYAIRNSEFHLSKAELSRLVAGTPEGRDRLMVQLFVFTAMRRVELQQLQRHDIDLERRRVIIRRGKGDKQRIVFLPPPLHAALRRYCDALPGSHLFTGRNGTPMSLRNINYILAKAGARAGVVHPNPRYRHVSPHLLRHSFARNWKRDGGSIESLKKILGHSSSSTTLDLYGTESQEETEENYQRMVESLLDD